MGKEKVDGSLIIIVLGKIFDYNYKDGKLDGLNTDWYENGQKRGEGTYKDDKED